MRCRQGALPSGVPCLCPPSAKIITNNCYMTGQSCKSASNIFYENVMTVLRGFLQESGVLESRVPVLESCRVSLGPDSRNKMGRWNRGLLCWNPCVVDKAPCQAGCPTPSLNNAPIIHDAKCYKTHNGLAQSCTTFSSAPPTPPHLIM